MLVWSVIVLIQMCLEESQRFLGVRELGCQQDRNAYGDGDGMGL